MKLFRKIGLILLVGILFFYVSLSLFKGTSASTEVPANPAFDDIHFYTCVVNKYREITNNTVIDSYAYLSDEQLLTITDLSCTTWNVSSVKGIDKLINLTSLTVRGNLTELDVSNNTKLTFLDVRNSDLEELDVSNNPELKSLDVSRNQLNKLDVSNNPELKSLDVSRNQLNKLDVSGASSLEILNANYNQLTKLDVSENAKLEELNVEYNKLTSLDISKNKLLKKLLASSNLLTNVEIGENENLLTLKFGDGDLSTGCGILTTGNVSYENGNKLTELDVSEASSLSYLAVDCNDLTELDVSKNTKLTKLYAEHSKLTKLDASGASSLEILNVDYSELVELDVSGASSLKILNVNYNELIELDMSGASSLEILYANYNQLTKLDVSENIKLTFLHARGNELTELDVSNNSALTELFVSDNELTELDVSNNSALISLAASYNQLTQLDLSNNLVLKNLYIVGNRFVENVYVYKGYSIKLGNNIKFPEQLQWDLLPIWTSKDSSVVSVNEEGVATANSLGTIEVNCISGEPSHGEGYYNTSMVNVVKITSDEYFIDEDNSNIYVGSDINEYVIKNNIDLSDENITVDVDLDNNKLYVKHEDEILKEFILLNFLIDNYKVYRKKIVVLDEVDYNSFVSNITISDDFTYKIFNDDEEVTSGNILTDMVLKIYYDGKEIDSYVITGKDEYLEIDDSLSVGENNIINNIVIGTLASDIVGKINTSGNISVLDKDDKVLESGSKLKTGDKIRIDLSGEVLIYKISVKGDTNGDGKVGINDIIQVSRHYIKGNILNGEEYINSGDINNNGKIDINDVIKLAKDILNGDKLLGVKK